MKNEKNITIQDLEKYYKPLVSDTCDKISNLSDEKVGYYAYLLQEELNKRDLLAISLLVSDNNGGVKNGILVSEPLQKITLPILDSSIKYEVYYSNLHQFELFFKVDYNGLKTPIVLRNGYLLKLLEEAGIKTFEEIDEYQAVLIFNNEKVNTDFCSFVKFKIKAKGGL